MQRYFIESSQINNNRIMIIGSDVHHIKNVMRMKIGEHVTCCDENQKVYFASIVDISDKIILEIIEELMINNELDIEVTIAHGLVRREKAEEVIRRMTELGGYEYIPLDMKRSIVHAKNDKSERWQRIIKEASEQSQRNRLMKVGEITNINDLLKNKQKYDLCLFADVNAKTYNFKEIINDFSEKSILIIVGPEGGFDKSEIETLLNNGFKAVSLGKTILRTETAPLYIMSVLNYEFGERK